MNTIIASFVNEVISELVSFLFAAFVCLIIGYIFGRKTATPWRKTRYFVDEEGWLRRWKYGQSNTELVWAGTTFVWFSSNRKLKDLLQNCQEVSSLKAYQMFPNAFKKI